MPPTDAHKDAEHVEMAAASPSKTSSETDRDTVVAFDSETGNDSDSDRMSQHSRRSSSVASCEEQDMADGPLILGPDNKVEIPTQNEFSSRKVVAHSMMDVALFMANISQLHMLLRGDIQFYIPLLCLVIISLTCQVIFAILILIIWTREAPKRCSDSNLELIQRSQWTQDAIKERVHVASVVMVYLIVVINMFITGLGIEPTKTVSQSYPISE